MRGSLVRRFTLLTVLIAFSALIPLVVFGLYAIQVVSNYLVRETVEKLQRSVVDDADKIKRAFDMAQGDLPILSQLPAVRELVRAKAGTNLREIELARTVVEQVFLTFSSNRKVYNQLRYLDENGREAVRVDYDGTHPPRLIPWERLQEQRQRDCFSETMTLGPGQVYVSPLGLNRERGQIEVPYRPTICYATALYDDAGHRRGIVIINLMAGPLLAALYQEAKAARKEVYVADQEGFYLLHSDPARQWGGPRDLNTGERIQRDFPILATQVFSRHAVATVTGEWVITSQSLAISSSRPDPSLVIIERMPTSIVLEAIADLRLYLLILLVGIGAVALVGAVLIGEKLTRPIVALERAATQIQQGDLEARVEASGSHEIVALGETFNAMAEGLAQSRGQIEQQLRELMALNRIGAAVSGTLSLDEVLDQALDVTLLCLGVEAGEIFLLDEEQGQVVLARHRGLAPEAFREISRFKLGDGFPGRVALLGEPLITIDLAKDLRFLRKQVIEAGFNTFASIPLKARGKVVGTLDVASHAPCAFTDRNLPLLATIGSTIGIAIVNARFYEMQRMTARELETKVEERTRELQAANLELEQAYQEVESASRHKSAFLATMSHELRTPLNAILGFAELLQDQTGGPLSDKQVRYASHIYSSGAHLLALINDLLDLSKVEAGKLELHLETFGLYDALASSLDELRVQAEAKQLAIDLRIDPPLAIVTADPLRFKQILLNLLSNAVKFTPDGGRITVTARQMSRIDAQPPDGDLLEIAVTDTGIGMKAEDLTKLFKPFTQLENSFVKTTQGTGLGLSLTKCLVELHGGQITAASEGPGLGSTFTVRLPVRSTV